MVFERMRKQMKTVLIVVVVTFAGSLLYFGGVSLWGRGSSPQVAAAIAKVNGEDISYQDFQKAYMDVVNSQQMQGQRITGSMIEHLRYSALDALINQQILLQEVANRKITVSKEQLDKKYNEFKSQFPSEDVFKEQLKAAGLTENELKNLLKDGARIDLMREQVVADVTVSEEEIADAYREAEVSHILIKPEGDSEEAKEKALKRAQDLVEKLRKGAKFEELAEQNSDDTYSAKDGGAIGPVKKDSPIVESVKNAAFSLKVGEISDPVESEFGYHIVKVTSRKEASGEDFEKAKEELKNQLLSQKQAEKASEWFESLKEKAEIVINDSQLHAHRLLMEGKTDEALEAYQKAIQENPDNGYLYKTLADLYNDKGDLDKALENLKLAASKVETDATLHYQLGKLYLEKDMKDEAVESFKLASKYDPNNYMLHAVLANEYKQLGMDDLYEEENAKFQEVIRRMQDLQKQQEEAAKQAEKAAESDEDGADTSESAGTEAGKSNESNGNGTGESDK